MGFLSTLVSCFFITYILWIIFRALNVKNGRKIYVILIVLFETGTIIFNIYYLIRILISDINNNLGFNTILADAYSFGSYPLAILTALIITLMLTLSDVKIFKSRRSRAFEREANGKKNIPAIIFNIVSITIGLILLGVAITILVLSKKLNAYFFTIGGFGLLFILIGLVILIRDFGFSNKERKPKGRCLFFIKTNGTYYTYLYEANNKSLEESLCAIGSTYILTDFGVIKTKDGKYNVFGITPNEIDDSLINSIELEKENRDFSPAFNLMNKYKRISITLDENNSVTSARDL